MLEPHVAIGASPRTQDYLNDTTWLRNRYHSTASRKLETHFLVRVYVQVAEVGKKAHAVRQVVRIKGEKTG